MPQFQSRSTGVAKMAEMSWSGVSGSGWNPEARAPAWAAWDIGIDLAARGSDPTAR